MHTLHHPIHFVVCTVWGLAHNFYTSEFLYICPRVLLYLAEEKNMQIIQTVQLVCHGNLLPEMENQLYYLSSFSFHLLFRSPGKMWSFLPRCASSFSPACQSLCRCCACIRCHLPTLGRPSMNTGGGSGAQRGDVLGLRTSLLCKQEGNIILQALPVFVQGKKCIF